MINHIEYLCFQRCPLGRRLPEVDVHMILTEYSAIDFRKPHDDEKEDDLSRKALKS